MDSEDSIDPKDMLERRVDTVEEGNRLRLLVELMH